MKIRGGWKVAGIALLMGAVLVEGPPVFVGAAPPRWWAGRGVLEPGAPAEDDAPANQGQAKHMAASAVAEMEREFAGGAGPALRAAISGWSVPSLGGGSVVARVTDVGDDFAPVNVGQLKALALPFYDRLISLHHTERYPWEGRVADDFGVVSVGDLKGLFGFEILNAQPPIIDPPGGSFFAAQSVRMKSAEPGARIHYTTDGSDPAESAQSVVSGGVVPLVSDALLRAVVRVGGRAQSAEAQARFLIDILPGIDSDGDGLSDYDEAFVLSTRADLVDTDGDGVPDAEELRLGTNPLAADSDGDGVPDGEDLFPSDPRRSSVLPELPQMVLDVSTPVVGERSVWSAALNDAGEVSFGIAERGDMVVHRWRAGSRLPALAYRGTAVGYGMTFQWLNAAGSVAGIGWNGGAQGPAVWHPGTERPAVEQALPEPEDRGGIVALRVNGFNEAGLAWGSCTRPQFDNVSAGPFADPNYAFAGGHRWLYRRPEREIPGDADWRLLRYGPLFEPLSVNASGAAIGSHWSDGRVSIRADAVAEGNVFHRFEGAHLAGLSDDGTVLGLSRDGLLDFEREWLPADALHPFVSTVADPARVPLLELLPERFRRQVAFVDEQAGVLMNSRGVALVQASAWSGPEDGAEWTPAQVLVDLHGGRLLATPWLTPPLAMNADLAMVRLGRRPLSQPGGGSYLAAEVLLPLEVMVDGDHDGRMSYSDPAVADADRTSPERPFEFWVNNDNDMAAKVDGNDWEEDDYPGDRDRNDEVIRCRRDLEDFARLWVSFKGLGSMVGRPGVEFRFELRPPVGDQWTKEDGAPAIRLYHACEKDGGVGYLFDDTVSWQQVGPEEGGTPFGRALGLVDPLRACALPTGRVEPVWQPPTEQDPFRHFLFEGVGEGRGRLVLCVYEGGLKVGEYPPVHLVLKPVHELFERWSVGSAGTSGVDGKLKPAAVAQPLRVLPLPAHEAERDYVLLVHGWNMAPLEKRQFAETAFKRLWHMGYRGRIGSFEWPTYYISSFPGQDLYLGSPRFSLGSLWTVFNKDNFDESERNAWLSGAGLLNCVEQLNRRYKGRVRVLAHSMGNVVTAEALRKAGRKQAIHTWLASQAAITAHCFDPGSQWMERILMWPVTPDVYSHAWSPEASGPPHAWPESQASYLSPDYLLGAAGRFVNLYNPGDYALGKNAWQVNQQMKPDTFYSYKQDAGFVKWEGLLSGSRVLEFDEHRFEAMAFAAQARGCALGQMGDARGVFTADHSLNVTTLFAPSVGGDSFAEHKYHSGQFRGTFAQRWRYWAAVLGHSSIRSGHLYAEPPKK